MNKSDTAELQAAYEDMLATITVMQAQVQALILASPHRPAIQHFYGKRMEHHLARGLGSPVSDSFLQKLEALHQEALTNMLGAPVDSSGTRPG